MLWSLWPVDEWQTLADPLHSNLPRRIWLRQPCDYDALPTFPIRPNFAGTASHVFLVAFGPCCLGVVLRSFSMLFNGGCIWFVHICADCRQREVRKNYGTYGTVLWIIFRQLFFQSPAIYGTTEVSIALVVLVGYGMVWEWVSQTLHLPHFGGKNLFNGVWFYLIVSCLVLTARIQERATASIAMCGLWWVPRGLFLTCLVISLSFFEDLFQWKGPQIGYTRYTGIPYTSPQPWTVDKASISGTNKFNRELLQADRSRSKLNVARTHTILPTHRSTRRPHLFNRTLAHCAGAIFWVENRWCGIKECQTTHVVIRCVYTVPTYSWYIYIYSTHIYIYIQTYRLVFVFHVRSLHVLLNWHSIYTYNQYQWTLQRIVCGPAAPGPQVSLGPMTIPAREIPRGLPGWWRIQVQVLSTHPPNQLISTPSIIIDTVDGPAKSCTSCYHGGFHIPWFLGLQASFWCGISLAHPQSTVGYDRSLYYPRYPLVI